MDIVEPQKEEPEFIKLSGELKLNIEKIEKEVKDSKKENISKRHRGLKGEEHF